MVAIQIVQLDAKDGKTADDTIQVARTALQESTGPKQSVIGLKIQDANVVQILSEWSNTQDSTAFTKSIQTTSGKPQTNFHVELPQSPFSNGLATAPVVEYVRSWFPVSRINSQFQQNIESDFSRFESIFRQGASGRLGMQYGWTIEEEDYEGVEGEKARSFIVVTGWQTMDHFQQAVQTEFFKEAIQILYAWQAPFKMVCILTHGDDSCPLIIYSGILSGKTRCTLAA
jgi:heme-degrading monooxygenase HmoA